MENAFLNRCGEGEEESDKQVLESNQDKALQGGTTPYIFFLLEAI